MFIFKTISAQFLNLAPLKTALSFICVGAAEINREGLTEGLRDPSELQWCTYRGIFRYKELFIHDDSSIHHDNDSNLQFTLTKNDASDKTFYEMYYNP